VALKIELEPRAPGCARLLVGGLTGMPETLALAIQRNNGKWLGPICQWQVTPHWHPQFSTEPMPDGLRLEIGADLVDSIIDAGGSPLQVTLRMDGVTEVGVLRMRGELVGSGAVASRVRNAYPTNWQTSADAGDTVILARPAGLGASDLGPDQGETLIVERPPAVTPPRRRRWPWIALAAVVLLAIAGLGAWQFDLFRRFAQDESREGPVTTPPLQADQAPADTSPPELPPPPPTTPELQPAPPSKGIALAREYLSGRPAAEAIFARAEQAEKDGDCPAAYAFFSGAANKAPALAARLARRYDPQTHTPGPCIGAPDIPYAIVYYSDAAEADDVPVQRRLGQLMVEREPSGPTRQAGLKWLRKAAGAGDAEAKHILEKLGDR
jgi:hypothetical protein